MEEIIEKNNNNREKIIAGFLIVVSSFFVITSILDLFIGQLDKALNYLGIIRYVLVIMSYPTLILCFVYIKKRQFSSSGSESIFYKSSRILLIISVCVVILGLAIFGWLMYLFAKAMSGSNLWS